MVTWTMRASRLRPCSLGITLLTGAFASGAVLLANQAARRRGLTDLDLPHVLGLSFHDPGERGLEPAGSAWYFVSGGVLVPVAYWLGFRAIGAAGARRGLALGVVHYLLSGLLLALTEPRHPKRARGQGRPMGPFLARYGPLERLGNLFGHLAYGTALGFAAAR